MKNLFIIIGISIHFSGTVFSQTDDVISAYQDTIQMKSDSLEIAAIYYKMGTHYQRQGDYKNASWEYENALRISIDSLGESHGRVSKLYHYLGTAEHLLNMYDRAEGFYKKALNINTELFGKDHSRLADTYNNLADLYRRMGNYEEAIDINGRVLEIWINELGEKHPSVADTYSNLAIIYEELGNYEKALALNKIALAIRLDNNDKYPLDESKSYNNLAIIHIKLGNYLEGLELIKKALEIKVSILGENHHSLANSYSNLAELYLELKDYQKSLLFEEKALKIRQIVFDEYNVAIANSYFTMAKVNFQYEDYENSLKLVQQTLKIRKKILGETHFDLGNCYSLISSIYLKLKDFSKAMEFSKKALENQLSGLGKEHVNTGRSYLNLANIHYKLGHYEDALEQNVKAQYIFEKKLGKLHQTTTSAYISLANINQALHNYDITNSLWQQIIEYSLKRLNETYIFLSNSQRLEFTESLKDVYETFYAYVADQGTESNRRLAADLSLNMKSLASEYSVSARELINNSDNKGVEEQYHKLISLRKDISRAELMTEEELVDSSLDIMTMRDQLENLTRQILTEPDIQNKLYKESLNWEDVQSKLDLNEVLLDFVQFQGESDNSVLYYALLIKKDIASPQFIPVTDSEAISYLIDLSSKNGQPSYIQSKKDLLALYQKVWLPLLPYLEGAQRVNVSLAGLLHLIDFEVLQDESGNFLTDSFEFHYYNSIRDFAKNVKHTLTVDKIKEKQKIYGVLFGDIAYDMSNDNEKDNLDGEVWRDGIDPLPATKDEIKAIGEIIQNNGWTVKQIQGINATERVFDNYVGELSPHIYHFATHGKYISPLDDRDANTSIKKRMNSSGNPLQRSMLMLSGADNTWTATEFISNSDQDGILTAYEISNLDLRHTNLVVLSACNTGLGDVHHTDGVIGLQSAFKLAGVENILVSLWKVNDIATKDLMILFYDNLLTKGLSTAAALRNAKQTMKNKGAKPENWAGFILKE